MKPSALYYRVLAYQPENIALLQREFELHVLESPADDTSELLLPIEVLFAPLGHAVDRRKMDKCPRLKVIVSNTTGHPHIDVNYARERGVSVACLKYAQEFLRTITPTAELTWGLILALTRNVLPAQRSVLAGYWDRRPFGGRAMLSSLTLGIVGLGRLGTMVARYAAAFGMKTYYFDPYVGLASEAATRVDTLGSLVERSDIVSIHVPHENDTEGMFSQSIFERMKPGSYLINTARGELLDWDALLANLRSGHLAGAALDVFEGEFSPGFQERLPEHPLIEYARSHDNLIITPHIGGSTIDAWRLTEAHAIEMALSALTTSRPTNSASCMDSSE